MPAGFITTQIDVAQLVLVAFVLFFVGLVIYLQRENRREGYPLVSDRPDGRPPGYTMPPKPKVFRLLHGGIATAPRVEPPAPPIAAVPAGPWPGAPLIPTGNPMVDGVGPAAWCLRAEEPDLTLEGLPKIVPLRGAADFYLAAEDTDPRGWPVIAADGKIAGHVRDLWIDRSETMVRFLETEVAEPWGPRTVLVPMTLAKITTGGLLTAGRPHVKVESLHAHHFADAPVLAKADIVTLREEDRIYAYFASGHLYAEPARLGPVL